MIPNSNIKIQKNDAPAAEVLDEILRYVKANWLQEVSGVCRNNYSAAVRGNRNGKPYRLSEHDLELLNAALDKMGAELFFANITREPNPDPDSLTFGATPAEQLKTMSGKVRVLTLMSEKLNVDRSFIKNKFISTTHNNYNRFSEQELRRMNEAVREIGLKILGIRMV